MEKKKKKEKKSERISYFKKVVLGFYLFIFFIDDVGSYLFIFLTEWDSFFLVGTVYRGN